MRKIINAINENSEKVKVYEGTILYRKIGIRNTCTCIGKCGKSLLNIEHNVLANCKQLKGVSICDECYNASQVETRTQAYTNSISKYDAIHCINHDLRITTNDLSLAWALWMHGLLKMNRHGFYTELITTETQTTRESTSAIVKKALEGNAKVYVNGVEMESYDHFKAFTRI